MRLLAALVGALATTAGATHAAAQDWYTLTNETADVTFTMVEREANGARVWLRFNTLEADVRSDQRLLLQVDCAQATVVAVEMRAFDATGNELGATPVPNAPLEERITSVVAYAACAYSPLEDGPRALNPSATGDALALQLRSDDQQVRLRAIETVLTQPGAFPPMIFVSLASALVREGRDNEAVDWFSFGYVRMSLDMRAAAMADAEYAGVAGIIHPMYGFSASHELSVAFDRLTDDEKRVLTYQALIRDRVTPRQYPMDWFTANNQAADVGWGAPQSPRPGSDFAIRGHLHAAQGEVEAAWLPVQAH